MEVVPKAFDKNECGECVCWNLDIDSNGFLFDRSAFFANLLAGFPTMNDCVFVDCLVDLFGVWDDISVVSENVLSRALLLLFFYCLLLSSL